MLIRIHVRNTSTTTVLPSATNVLDSKRSILNTSSTALKNSRTWSCPRRVPALALGEGARAWLRNLQEMRSPEQPGTSQCLVAW